MQEENSIIYKTFRGTVHKVEMPLVVKKNKEDADLYARNQQDEDDEEVRRGGCRGACCGRQSTVARGSAERATKHLRTLAVALAHRALVLNVAVAACCDGVTGAWDGCMRAYVKS